MASVFLPLHSTQHIGHSTRQGPGQSCTRTGQVLPGLGVFRCRGRTETRDRTDLLRNVKKQTPPYHVKSNLPYLFLKWYPSSTSSILACKLQLSTIYRYFLIFLVFFASSPLPRLPTPSSLFFLPSLPSPPHHGVQRW